VNDDGVTCVVAAGVTGYDVELLGENVDDLALALVAPLGTEDDGGLTLGLAHRLGAPDNLSVGVRAKALAVRAQPRFYTGGVLMDGHASE
jgi:hypothetical protein